jgi:hypothetical protein
MPTSKSKTKAKGRAKSGVTKEEREQATRYFNANNLLLSPPIKRAAYSDGLSDIPDMLPHNLINQMVDDKFFRGPLGWKVVKDNGDWIRTGSMAGTSALVKRQSNGFSWVVIINTSSWNGPRLPAYIDGMMDKIERRINNWPNHDLFEYKPEVSHTASIH